MRKPGIIRRPRLSALAIAVQAAVGLPSAWALPQGAQVVSGQVAISQGAPGTLQVTAGNGAIINWQSFSLGAGELARFVQPSAQSAVLNRVTGAQASDLLGQLQANGRVFLINPNGIVVGSGARIDTNSFVASTLDIADADFLAGRMRFMATGSAGGIRNEGLITAGPGGKVALIAPDIVNSGIIHAPGGEILLAAGRSIEIASTDQASVRFEVQAPTDSVLNLGKLLADNGAVRAFAATLRNAGEIRADRLVQGADGRIELVASGELQLMAGGVVSASGGTGGQVRVQSLGGTTRVGGTVAATGDAGTGGSVQVLGERVALDASALVDASGATGGGQVLVGGDYQGANAQVQNASRVSVAAGARLRADATAQGDGGRVIVWADENTRFGGAISARGGALGGNGGFAEVSGKQNLSFTGSADLSAPRGALGTLLLDPMDIVVAIGSGILPTVTDEFADFADNVVTIDPTRLAALGANVTLQASRHVFIKDRIALTTSGAGLTVLAGGAAAAAGGIYLEHTATRPGGISTQGGSVVLRGQSVEGPGSIQTAGGAVDIQATGSLAYSGAIDSGGGAVTLQSLTGSVTDAQVSAGSGSISVSAMDEIAGGSYSTSGSASFTSTESYIALPAVSAGTVNLSAASNIDANVAVSGRVDATSTSSWVQLDNLAGSTLRLGTVRAATGIYLYANNGIEQAAGGSLQAPDLDIWAYGSAASIGSAAAPLNVVGSTPTSVGVQGLQAPAHLRFGADTVLSALSLEGSVTALGGSTITGGASLGAWTFGVAPGALQFSATTGASFNGALSLTVDDGGLQVGTLDMGAGGAFLQAAGAVSLGTVRTTRTSGTGLDVYAQQCSWGEVCMASSPITVGTIEAAGSSVWLQTADHGDIRVTGTVRAGSLNVEAGNLYSVYNGVYPAYYLGYPTTNQVVLSSVETTGGVTVSLNGHGTIDIDRLAARGSVSLNAGASSSYYIDTGSGYALTRTSNQVDVNLAEPAGASGSFSIINRGLGDILLAGGVQRSFGSVNLQASNGSITGSAAITTGSQVTVNASGAVSLQSVTAGSSVNVTAGDNLLFDRIASSGSSVTLSSARGSVNTRLDDAAADVSAAGGVTITALDAANGSIGDAALGNPLDIRAGATATVTLNAGRSIGAQGREVRVDTEGAIKVSSAGGQFHVAALDLATDTLRNVGSIDLTASAAGLGVGGTSRLRSANLDVQASSDGTDLTLGGLSQSAGTLNLLRFTAKGGGLHIGDVSFTGSGHRQLALASDGFIDQQAGNIAAGHTTIDAQGAVSIGNVTIVSSPGDGLVVNTSGDIRTGALQARSISLSGANLDLQGDVSTTGTLRGWYGSGQYSPRQGSWIYTAEELQLQASGHIDVAGSVSASNSARLTAGGDIRITNGASAGTSMASSYTDTLSLNAQGAVRAANLQGALVDLRGADVQVGNISASSQARFDGGSAGTLVAGAVNAPNVQFSGAQLSTGTIDSTGSVWLQATAATPGALDTGTITAAGNLDITVGGAYAPMANLSAGGRARVTAAGDIIIRGGTTLSANEVVLTTTAESGGNIDAALRNTTRLTLNADRGFDVNVDSAQLSELNVNAQWNRATGAGSNGASVAASLLLPSQLVATQTFQLTDRSLDISSLDVVNSWSVNYTDSATAAMVQPLAVSINHPLAGGAFAVDMASDTALQVDAYFGGPAALDLTTGGDIWLTGISTLGGRLNATTRGGDIHVGSVQTTGLLNANGGNVTLVSQTGSIEGISDSLGLVTAFNLGSETYAAGGNVVLDARQGSIGAGGNLVLSYARDLTLRARDTIGVAVGGAALSSLEIEAAVAGSQPGSTISVNALNFLSPLTVGRDTGANRLTIGGLTQLNLQTDLRLAATDGGIAVTGDLGNGVGPGLRNVSLDAQGGDLSIVASGGPRSVLASGTLDLRASGDIRLNSGNVATDTLTVSGAAVQMNAGQDLAVEALGAAVQVTSTAATYSQRLEAGRDIVLRGGSGTGASAAINGVGGTGNYQYLVAGRDITIEGGSGTDASATLALSSPLNQQSITAGGNVSLRGGTGNKAHASLSTATANQYLDVGGNVTVQGGAGQDSYASWALGATQSGYQYGNIGGSLVVQGGNAATGQGSGAYAVFAGGTQALSNIGGSVQVIGGTAAGNRAELSSRGTQSLGIASSYYGATGTDFIRVQGGSGDGAEAVLSGALGQTLYAGRGSLPEETGHIEIIGGSGANARAAVTSGGTQTVGSTADGCYYYGCNLPTQNLILLGGSGLNASASLRSTGSQSIRAGGVIKLVGGNATGSVAEIVATGATADQTIGSTSTSSNDSTDLIEVRGGSVASATITAGRNQTLQSSGNIVVQGGSGADATATIVALAGSQILGTTSTSSQDATNDILVQGGSGANAYAAIRAATGQALRAGGTIALAGGGTGAFAEVVTTAGAQQVGVANTAGDPYFDYYNDATDRITLTGGQAGAYARFATGGQQLFAADQAIELTGGALGAQAQIAADGGQTVQSLGSLVITGGAGSGTGTQRTGIVNRLSGEQLVSAGTGLSLVGGSGASDVGIVQLAAAAQTVTAGGALSLSAPSASSGTVSIESAGSQAVQAGGAISLDNQGAQTLRLHATGGSQNLQAHSLSVTLGGSLDASFAGVSTANGHDQSITVRGDGATAGSATVTVRNTSTGTGALAGITSSGALSLHASDDNYDTAGAVQVGHTADTGRSEVSAATDLDLVAGSLTIQGGATAAAEAAVNATGTMTLSSLYGGTQLLAGAAGSASIDPLLLNVVSNGSVLLQGGGSAGAFSSIQAGTFNLAATVGDLSLVNSLGTATIEAVTFNFTGPNAVNLAGGTITVSSTGDISIDGLCINCDTNLKGSFSIRSYVPPLTPPPGPGTGPGTVVTVYDVPTVANNVISLTDAWRNTFELVLLEDGTVSWRPKGRNQCL